MLPFTKRPGRAEESGEVVTKESLAAEEASLAPGDNKSDRPRPFAKSISDEELTTLMPSKSVAVVARPTSAPPPPLSSRPAAPLPNSTLRSARSVPPPRGKFMREEDEGKTAVRGAPKIVKKKGATMGMPTSPTTVSPAAVIKATLETARSAKRNDLMAPPPKELLEELADLHPADANPATVQLGIPRSQPPSAVAQTTASMNASGFAPVGIPNAPPSRSVPPAPRSHSAPPPSYPVPHAPHSQSHGGPPMMGHPYAPYGVPVPPASVSVPGVVMQSNPPPSMPAHFMVPHAPYSDARMDPPGTVVPASARSGGRSAASWAMALLALGLGVGIGGISLMRGNADGFLDTTAAFIDPARAAAPRAGSAPAAPAAEPVPAEAPKVAAAPPAAAPPVEAAPAVAVAAAVMTTAAAPAAQPVAAPAAHPAAHPAAPAPVAVAVAPAPVHVAAAAPPARVEAPRPVAAPAQPKAAPAPAAPPPAPRVAAAPKPTADETPAPTPKAASKATKSGGKAAAAGGSDIDEETKKALEALQKSQLESSF